MCREINLRFTVILHVHNSPITDIILWKLSEKITLQSFVTKYLTLFRGNFQPINIVTAGASLGRVPRVPLNPQNFEIYLMEPALRLTLY